MRILIVEDEKRLAGTLQDLLRRQGYTADVCYDGISGLDNARSDIYDLLVLDAMLPGMDGFALLRQLRGGGSRLPVLMLTAHSELNDRVRGLDAGADYYLTKPFEPEELLARVENILRRAQKERTRFVFGALTVDLPSRRVTKDGREVALTALEFDLLAMLVRRNNVALSREALLAGVWGYAYQGETRTVDVHIQRLRGKIGAEYIETVYKYGYRFCGKEVERR